MRSEMAYMLDEVHRRLQFDVILAGLSWEDLHDVAHVAGSIITVVTAERDRRRKHAADESCYCVSGGSGFCQRCVGAEGNNA